MSTTTTKIAVTAATSFLLLIVVFIAAATGGLATNQPGSSQPSDTALADIPPAYLLLYQQAATACPGLDWTVLAAVGKIESDHGRSNLPGVKAGSNAFGAGGPMQQLQSTWDAIIARHPIPAGGTTPPSRYNPHDAIWAAAFYLCDSGADRGQLRAAIFAYNHANWYVDQVLAQAARYAAPPAPAGPAGPQPPPQAATVPDPSGTGGQVTPRTAAVYQAAKAAGLIRTASCFGQRPELPTSDHPTGRACDFSFNPHDPTQVAAGWRLANWLTTNAATYGVKYLIWQGQIWQANQPGWSVYQSGVYGCPNPANLTGCHYDHVHLSLL